MAIGKECPCHSVLPSASPCAPCAHPSPDGTGCKYRNPKWLIFIALFIRKTVQLKQYPSKISGGHSTKPERGTGLIWGTLRKMVS